MILSDDVYYQDVAQSSQEKNETVETEKDELEKDFVNQLLVTKAEGSVRILRKFEVNDWDVVLIHFALKENTNKNEL